MEETVHVPSEVTQSIACRKAKLRVEVLTGELLLRSVILFVDGGELGFRWLFPLQDSREILQLGVTGLRFQAKLDQ